MCGRFTLTIAREDLRAAFPFAADPLADASSAGAPAGLPARWNIAPTQHVAVIANREAPRLEFFHWGLIPSWAADPRIGNRLINARSETLAEKPSFRTAFRKRRCLILADGFYEWAQEGGRKAPMYIRLKSGAPFAFAGLWEIWRAPDGTEVCSCAIVTRAAEEPIAAFHARMPVILTAERYTAWLDPAPREPAELAPLLAPLPAGLLEVYPVSRLVNSPAHDVPGCIEPLRADALDPADPPRP